MRLKQNYIAGLFKDIRRCIEAAKESAASGNSEDYLAELNDIDSYVDSIESAVSDISSELDDVIRMIG